LFKLEPWRGISIDLSGRVGLVEFDDPENFLGNRAL
jgi:hypothetical protein